MSDSHGYTLGVSRDEAMASGLVPITNAVAAIREFVDEKCGILANAEDAEGLASGIAMLHDNPEMFQAFSRAASERVGIQTSSRTIIEKELRTFMENDPSVTLI
jgi:glycosyltransferase involved in cell wall biosynthesis